MGTFGLSRAGVEAAIDDLVATRGVAVVKGTKRILMSWPFSAVATEFAERG